MAFSLRVRVLACAECKETLSVYSLFVFTAGNQGDKLANLTMGPPRKITSHQPLLGPRRSPPPRGLRRTPTHTVEYARATHPRRKRTRGGERRRTRKSDMTCNFIKHTCCSSMCVRQGDVRALARSLARSRAHTHQGCPQLLMSSQRGLLLSSQLSRPFAGIVYVCVCARVRSLHQRTTVFGSNYTSIFHFPTRSMYVYMPSAQSIQNSLCFLFFSPFLAGKVLNLTTLSVSQLFQSITSGLGSPSVLIKPGSDLQLEWIE